MNGRARGRPKGSKKVRYALAWCIKCRATIRYCGTDVRRYTHIICRSCDARVPVHSFTDVPLMGTLDGEAVIIVDSAGYKG